LVMVYNDGYAPMIGKHPISFAANYREVCADVYVQLKGIFDQVCTEGKSVLLENALITVERSDGTKLDRFFTLCFAPLIFKEMIWGCNITGTEVTDIVLSNRRSNLLTSMSFKQDLPNVSAATTGLSEILRQYPTEFPSVTVYEWSEDSRKFLVSTREDMMDDDVITEFSVEDDEKSSGKIHEMFLRAYREKKMQVIDVTGLNMKVEVAEEPVRQLCALPLTLSDTAEKSITAILLICVNPRYPFEGEYSDFISMIGIDLGHLLTGIKLRVTERRRAEDLLELDKAKTQFFHNKS